MSEICTFGDRARATTLIAPIANMPTAGWPPGISALPWANSFRDGRLLPRCGGALYAYQWLGWIGTLEASMTLGGLIERLGGKLVQGSAETALTGVSSTLQAGPGHLVFAQDAASATDALSSSAAAVVLRPGLVKTYPEDK